MFHYHQHSEGGIVFSSVCLCVCLSVNTIPHEPLVTKVSGRHPMFERADKLENGYCEVHGWAENVDVLFYTLIHLFCNNTCT